MNIVHIHTLRPTHIHIKACFEKEEEEGRRIERGGGRGGWRGEEEEVAQTDIVIQTLVPVLEKQRQEDHKF